MSVVVDYLQAAAAVVGAVSVLGGAVWWVLRPRFVELVERTAKAESAAEAAARQLQPNGGKSARDVVDRVESMAVANRKRLDELAPELAAIKEGLHWSGRALDTLATSVDRIARLQEQQIVEQRDRRRRFDPTHPEEG